MKNIKVKFKLLNLSLLTSVIFAGFSIEAKEGGVDVPQERAKIPSLIGMIHSDKVEAALKQEERPDAPGHSSSSSSSSSAKGKEKEDGANPAAKPTSSQPVDQDEMKRQEFLEKGGDLRWVIGKLALNPTNAKYINMERRRIIATEFNPILRKLIKEESARDLFLQICVKYREKLMAGGKTNEDAKAELLAQAKATSLYMLKILGDKPVDNDVTNKAKQFFTAFTNKDYYDRINTEILNK